MINFFFTLLLILPIAISAVTRVTCIGDSITEGGACESSGYVPLLQDYLGDEFVVTNAGKSSMTMLKKGLCNDQSPCSYWDTDSWQLALSSQPDIVTIMLGTNDAKYPYNWEVKQQEEGDYYSLDYVDMIRQLRRLRPVPHIFLMVPPPLLTPGIYDMNETVVNSIFPKLTRDIATVMDAEIIDLYTAINNEVDSGILMECDGCHPTAAGNEIIVQTMYPYITDAADKIKKNRKDN
jgi:acyl-CoA thioesterase-1